MFPQDREIFSLLSIRPLAIKIRTTLSDYEGSTKRKIYFQRGYIVFLIILL